MTIAVLALLVTALAAPAVLRLTGRASGLVLAAVPFALLLYFVSAGGVVAGGEPVLERTAWAPSLGADLTFRLDGLSLLFALLICGIGALVLLYSGAYLAGHPHQGNFYLVLLLFMASMLGLVLADNLIALFVFWELTSITSFFLIGFEQDRASARASALQALVVTAGGGLALLAGFVLMGIAAGSFELSALLASPAGLGAHPLYVPILLLVVAGAFTKSAQVPFHFWLPAAMEAPTPVSAYLHSATMVKAGVYLLARVSPILGGTELWFWVVGLTGGVTMVTGGLIAIVQTDLKRVLAFSTVSALGALTMLLGIGTRTAVEAAFVFLLAHALYKGALFLVAGSIDHETGTRDVRELGGLRRLMPWTAGAAVVAGVSFAGFGPVLSFIGKERLIEAVLEAEEGRAAFTGLAIAGAALFVAVALIAVARPFFGAVRATPKHAHEAPAAMWIGPIVLATLGLVLGVLPLGAAEPVVAWSAAATLGEYRPVYLPLWHGFTIPLALSAVSVAAGVLVFAVLPRLSAVAGLLRPITAVGPTRWYDWVLDGVNGLARVSTRILQNGYLRYYLTTILLTTLFLVTPPLMETGIVPGAAHDVRPGISDLVLAGLITLAGVSAARSTSRLGAVTSLGAAGVGVALIYVMYGAPDLAITQVLVETLTVILFVLVFYSLPRFSMLSSYAARARDAVLALAVGGLMTTLLLASSGTQPSREVTEFLTTRSQPDGHGRNIVNVILVDFRGLDTLGEITVLALAGVGVFALLRLRPEDFDES